MDVRESLEAQGGVVTAVQYVRALARMAEGKEKPILTKRDLEDLFEMSDEIEGLLAEGKA